MRLVTGFILLLLVVALSHGANGQENDFGTWLGVELEKKITNKLRLEFEEEVRIFQNVSEIDRFATSFGGAWTFNSYLRAGAGYTWIYKHRVNKELWEHRHRYQIYLRGRVKVDRFTFTLRERFQSTYRDESIKGFNYSPRNYLRSRLQAAYNIKGSKIAPYGSAELYYQLNNPEGNKFDNMRYTLGTGWPLSKTMELDTYLRLDQEMNVKNPVSYWILGVALNVGL
ncbi:MAG: DUF2490 domain-containing protein [Bacteroidota bacterium]